LSELPQDTRERLQRWLRRHLPGPTVSQVESPATDGQSSTLLFEATWRENGQRRRHGFAVRFAPAEPVGLDLVTQFRVLRLLDEIGTVPVPRVWSHEPSSALLGAPFFLLNRVEGRVPPEAPPYTCGSWLSDASTEDQRRLQDASVDVLAAIHDVPPERFAFLGGGGPDVLRANVNRQRELHEAAGEAPPSPHIERTFAWLEDHWPQRVGPAVLCWGDAHIGNIVYRDFAPAAVLDWEQASLGPRELDVACFIWQHRFLEDIAASSGSGGMPDFLRCDDVVARYEAASGTALQDLDWYLVYADLRHAVGLRRRQREADS
jgi:aminoglycoside phosphotransferase (APT) family kinase protein